MSGFEKDLNQWITKEKVDGGKLDPVEVDWIKDFKIDTQKNQLTFMADLTFTDEFRPVSITVPNTYPKGVYKYQILNLDKTTRSDTLESVMYQVLDLCEDKRDVAINNLVTPTPKGDDEPETPWTNENMWGDDDDDDFTEVQEEIANDIKAFNKENKNDGWYVVEGAVGKKCFLYILIDPKKRLKVKNMVASAWGIDMDKFISVSLTFSDLYKNDSKAPGVTSFQSGTAKKLIDGSELSKRVSYGLYWTVQNRIKEAFFGKFWPLEEKYTNEKKKTGKGYLYRLLEIFEDTIQHCAGRCLICHKELPFEGVKPVVCDSKMCQFSHESFGLGVNIESEIKNNPDLVDLMITMGYAACTASSNKFNPFNPYPSGLNCKSKDKETGEVKEFSLKRTNDKDNSKVKAIINEYPPVKKMLELIEKGIFKEEIYKIHPLAYSLLRWLMASNRCHLRKLTKREEIKQMNCKYQYVLLSSTPEKEERFQKLKKKYGTIWAFHGSALCNWHAIMRVGLKNMSGTSGQINGAAYGSGVYLANDSGTSFSYIRYQQGWKNSMFGSSNLGVMALCEIAKHPDTNGMPNPYYVIKNDELLQTRYFFVYPGSGSANVIGKTLKPPPLLDN